MSHVEDKRSGFMWN